MLKKRDYSVRQVQILFLVFHMIMVAYAVMFLHPYYGSNDEFTLAAIASGAYGSYTWYFIYLHSAFAWILRFFYTLYPAWNWYTLVMYGLIFVSLSAIGCTWIRRSKRIGGIMAVLLVLASLSPMKTAIRAAGAEGDSVGGVLETAILGLPAGIGEPYFDSVESEIAHLAFSIPAVKGIEFGTGFGFAGLRGSEANDAFRMTAEGAVVTATNHNAGINGGIANGMPVVFRTAVKPTPSIYKQQDTVDYIAKKDAQLSIQGRHDPCIVPRAAIVQTCAAALAVGDLLTARYGARWMTDPTGYRKED